MSDELNKRKHPRVSVILKVEYETARDFLADYTSNASDTGLFIATENPFEVGDLLEFSISFPGLLAPIRCRAEVRWRRAADQAADERMAGIGVSFLFDSAEQRNRIKELIMQLNRSGTPSPIPTPAQAPSQTQEQARAPFRALLAEDNPLVREMLRFALRKFHSKECRQEGLLEIIEVENGQMGWEKLIERDFDLAIVDYFMPVMDGGQLIRKIRESKSVSHLPIIAVSVGGEETRRAAYEAGADLFLDKPLMLARLIESLQRLLRVQIKES